MSRDEKTGYGLASPIGAFGFAFAAWIVGYAFCGLTPLTSALAAAVVCLLFMGGLMQFTAGRTQLLRGSHAVGFIFTVYGAWGLATGFLLLITLGLGIFSYPSASTMAMYWIGWAIVSLILAITVIPTSKMFSIACGWVMVCFILFAVGSLTNSTVTNIGGWLTLLLGLYVFYLGGAESINESYGKHVLFFR